MVRRPRQSISHRWIMLGFGALVTLAGVQLVVQRAAHGLGSGPDGVSGWLWLFGANLVASLPWLPSAYAIVWWTKRHPPASPRGMALHGLGCAVVTLVFLVWLSLFHAALPGDVSASDSVSVGEHFLRNLGDFAVMCVVLYGLVAAMARHLSAPNPGAAGGETTEERPAENVGGRSAQTGIDPKPLVIPSGGTSRLLDPATILWVEADEGYARLETESGAYLLRRSLSKLAADLEPLGFARIHRSTIVRLDRVEEVRRLSHGEAMVRLREGREFKVSRTYRDALEPLGI